jgi:hypothetical protein
VVAVKTCELIAIFITSVTAVLPEALAVTTTTTNFTPSDGTYTVSTHTGSSYISTQDAITKAIGSAAAVSSGTGILYSVGCNLVLLYPPQNVCQYSTASQGLNVDLSSYQSSNGYTKAWFEWVCRYSVGPG